MKVFGLIILSLVIAGAFAQEKKIVFQTDSPIRWAGVDRPGDLLLVLDNGEVQKFDKQGKKVGSYSFKTPPSSLDPMDGTKSFYFQRTSLRYGNLSSDMSTATERALDPAFAISPVLLSPSSLHELWILDSSDFSLKKTKMSSMAITAEAELKHTPAKKATDYLYMREYQNYLFVLDKTAGIHVFNSLGKYLKTLGEKDISYFSFLGEEVYYLKGRELRFVDLYTDEKRSLPIVMECRFALLTDDKIYLVETNKISILDFKP